jgi:drug/metabolite transporter (DMT)-like permease
MSGTMPANDRHHRILPPPGRARLVALVAFAMTAFAMNSVLCRLALGTGAIDAVTFTAVRLGSGAVCLALLVGLPRGWARRARRPDVAAAAMLLVYALAFSLAYRDLTAATGALLLFALVQTTMLAWGLRRGERLRPAGWAGVALAIGGLVVLTAPGLAAPPVRGALLMALAGVA